MKKSSFSVASMVTERVLSSLNAALEAGQKLPWHKSWVSTGIGKPFNPKSKTEYRGINFFLLAFFNGVDSQFLTLKQANELGGHIKKGATANPITYFNFLEKEEVVDGNKQKRRIPMLKYYNVFNVDDVEGVALDKVESREIVINDFAEQIISNAAIHVNYKGSRAFYSPTTDEITLPIRDAFFSDDHYYSTLFHELIHSTASRVGRNSTHKKAEYAYEELVAELGASMLCAHAGIDAFETDHTAAYIQGWVSALNNDHQFIIQAAQHAQKAVDFLLGTSTQALEVEELAQ